MTPSQRRRNVSASNESQGQCMERTLPLDMRACKVGSQAWPSADMTADLREEIWSSCSVDFLLCSSFGVSGSLDLTMGNIAPLSLCTQHVLEVLLFIIPRRGLREKLFQTTEREERGERASGQRLYQSLVK